MGPKKHWRGEVLGTSLDESLEALAQKLARELAWRRTALIALFNIVVALGVGGLVSRLWGG